MLDIVLRVVAFVLGAYLVIYTFVSATRTFVVPRSEYVQLKVVKRVAVSSTLAKR